MQRLASVMATNEGKVLDYAGPDRVPKKGIPKIFIPTSAGSGAEVTRMAGVTDESENAKRDISSVYNLPDAVILDPLLTLSLPSRFTAETGIDGLAHAIESYVAVGASPFAEILAIEAIRLISENLPVAYARGEDLEARSNMLLASAVSGLALGGGKLGAVHGLAFALEAVSDLSHARTIGIMLPHVMDYNKIGNPEKYAQIAKTMGESIEGLSIYEAAGKAVTAVERLLANLNISVRLSDYGISKQKLTDLVAQAMKLSVWFEPNPRNITEDDIKNIYVKAFG